MGPSRSRPPAEDGHRPGGAVRRHLRRGAALGLRGHRARHPGLVAGGGRDRLVRDARADRPVDSRVLRPRRRDQARRLRRDRGRRGLRRQVAAHDGQARRRRVGPQRHQGLHLQRRDRRRHRRRRHGGPRAGAPRPGFLRRAQGHAGPVHGQEGGQARHSRLADGRGRPRRLPDPARPPAGRDGQARAQARAGPLGQGRRLLRRAGDLRGHPADGRRLGAGHRRGRLRLDARLARRPRVTEASLSSSSSASSR